MTEQDRAGIPAKASEYRARNSKTGETTMLQYPGLIQHFPDHVLQKRNDDGTWSAFELPTESPAEDAHEEDGADSTG